MVFIVGSGIAFAFSNKSGTKEGLTVDKKVLVAYFSATGTTKNVAKKLAKAMNADSYEIEPEIPYTDDDLDWRNKSSRSSVEMNNRTSRPQIKKDDFSVSKYDVIFLGFPIWWGSAPTIVNTFLEQHDFSNKKIILFATSGMSGMGKTIKHLKPSAPGVEFVAERRFDANVSQNDIGKWVQKLKL